MQIGQQEAKMRGMKAISGDAKELFDILIII